MLPCPPLDRARHRSFICLARLRNIPNVVHYMQKDSKAARMVNLMGRNVELISPDSKYSQR